MNANEIVRALHKYAKNAQENFEADTMRDFDSAADLIESMQAQLADYHHMSELVDGKMEENQRLRRINENLHAQLAEKTALLDATIAGQETLQRALAASQRRADAAVEDIYKMTDGGECDICKHYNHDKNTCAQPDVHYDDCFEWRGPQEAGKGVTE